jgi:hypothetical protein
VYPLFRDRPNSSGQHLSISALNIFFFIDTWRIRAWKTTLLKHSLKLPRMPAHAQVWRCFRPAIDQWCRQSSSQR